MPWYGGGFEFPEYVSVGTRRARARAAAEKIARKQKRSLAPVGPTTWNRTATMKTAFRAAGAMSGMALSSIYRSVPARLLPS